MAWAVALLAWLATGGFATSVERAGVPANHVTHLIASGRIDSSEPLRWRGRREIFSAPAHSICAATSRGRKLISSDRFAALNCCG